MNSRLYDCTVMHHRLSPVKNKFVYKIFMFYLDLDEVDSLNHQQKLFSRNRFNLFALYDRDHLTLGKTTVKENILKYLKSQGIDLGKGKIFLLTNLRTLGYVFNPVSFYFCFNEEGKPECTISEVGNTFKELKPYLLSKEAYRNDMFHRRMTKHFYVSPFIDLGSEFDFQIMVPKKRLQIQIDDYKKGKRFLLTSLTGTQKSLTDITLLLSFLRVPFVTLKVIALIHYQALRLVMQGLVYNKKADNPELQKGVFKSNK